MNYMFSEEMRQVLATARNSALGNHYAFVGVEHVTVALLAARGTVAGEVVRCLEVDPQELREAVLSWMPAGDSPARFAELPYSMSGKAVLENAVRAAQDEDTTDLHTGHLLLGIVGAGEVGVSEILRVAGLSPHRVRAALDGVDRSLG